MPHTNEFISLWPNEAATAACASQLAAVPDVRDAIVALSGDLGAGKTSFVRHLLRALGVRGRVRSPTYALAEPHEAVAPDGQAPTAVWHFDFYRFGDPREWEDAGLRDIFAQRGLKLVEWPERAAGFMPTPDLSLHIDVLVPSPPSQPGALAADCEVDADMDVPAPRRVHWQAHSARGQCLLDALQRPARPPAMPASP